jgi:hypothetical protein
MLSQTNALMRSMIVVDEKLRLGHDLQGASDPLPDGP